jgi:hypothetical protein
LEAKSHIDEDFIKEIGFWDKINLIQSIGAVRAALDWPRCRNQFHECQKALSWRNIVPMDLKSRLKYSHVSPFLRLGLCVGLITGLSFSAAAQEPVVTADYVRNLVKSQSLGTVDAVIASLPKHYRSSFVLIHDSQSIQQASFENPRVLLVGADDIYGKSKPSDEAIISFNGKPDQFGSDRIEILQWLTEQRRFELSEITFLNGQSRVSKSNPVQCLSCHGRGGDEAAPIWNPYFRWPGAYGSEDGHIKSGSHEDNAFRNFIAKRDQNPRYAALIPQGNLDFTTSKYAYFLSQGEKLNPQLFDHQGGYWIEPYLGNGLDNLSQRLDRENAQRIERQIEESPHFNDYKKILSCSMGYWADTQFKNSYFTQNFISDSENIFSEYFARVKRQSQNITEFSESDLRPDGESSPNLVSLAFFSQLFLGIDPTKWTIAPATSALFFNRPASGSTARDLYLYSQDKWGMVDTQECSSLISESMKGIPKPVRYAQNWVSPILLPDLKGVPQVALICASCHTGFKDHDFPFANREQMKKIMTPDLRAKIVYRISPQAHAAGDGMPYGQPVLSEENQRALVNYIDSL